MAVVATLSASDYANFTQKYSDKNIINNIYGKEYVILKTDSHELTTLSGDNPKEVEVNVSDISRRLSGSAYRKSIAGPLYNRTEEGYIRGRFIIKTDEVVADPNSVSVSVNVEYDRYEKNDDIINSSNFDSEKLIYTSIINSQNKKNTEPLLRDGGVERAVAVFYRTLFGFEYDKERLEENDYEGKVTKKILKNADGTLDIVVDYKILVWSAANSQTLEIVFAIPVGSNILAFLAKKITFTVKSNTVETTELEFQYNIDDFIENSEAARATAKTYQMETNEFLQTEETSDPTDRMSYKIASQVFDAFDKNRPIITFDLLNCEKYKIGDRERYLESGDQIMVLDEFGQYIGEELDENGELIPGVFEIIKVENKWNGSYHKIVTAKQINT